MESPAQPRAAFRPEAVSEFAFVDRDLDCGVARLRYALGDAGSFEETIALPAQPAADVPASAVDGALDLLHLAAGVSYFKAADPPGIEPGPLALTPALAHLGSLLYGEGMAEFRYRNGLPVNTAPAFEPTAAAGADALAGAHGALVPVGGGKDSIVAIEALKRAGIDATLFSVGDTGPIARTAGVAGLEHLVARRSIDSRLLELNAAGALNGHVPVTAIVSAVAVLVAVLGGYSAVVMANERSASEATLQVGGVEVNHQFSKGFRAERAMRDAIHQGVASDLEYFSLLRPFGEPAIARSFAGLRDYHEVFTSCNGVFRIDPGRRESNWCTDCPKCRFVFLMLAPFLPPSELIAIFGRNLLDDPAQFDGFAELVAWPAHKPFECVGTVSESAVALRTVAADPAWASFAVAARLRDEVLPHLPEAREEPAGGEHLVPDAYAGALDAVERP